MAEMGLGYGSEYQLLRYLGHHRNKLNIIIREQTRLKGELIWLDFPPDNNRLSLDGEWKGINFLTQQQQETLKGLWGNYWTGNTQNWDAIIIHIEKEQIEYVIVEAKAHLKEIESDCSAEKDSTNETKIKNAFERTKNTFGVKTNNDWLKQYYQLANRLAFINFLHSQNINCSLLNVYFINGYSNKKGENKSVKDKEEWAEAIQEEYNYLGINDNARKYISEVFIDCKI
jgi:hypothetical protein